MSQLIIDLFFALIFILLTIFLMRIKEKAFPGNRESYRYTIAGIIILFFASVIRLADHQNMFESCPFLSEPIYCALAEVIAIVTGIALMIAGVSVWLPRRHKKARIADGEHGASDIYRKIENEIFVIRSVNHLFDRIPRMLCQYFGFEAAAVVRKNHRRGRFVVTNEHRLPEETSALIADGSFGRLLDSGSMEEACRRVGSAYMMPLMAEGDLRAVFFFWREADEDIDVENKLRLEMISRALSRRLGQEIMKTRLSLYQRMHRDFSRCQDINASRSDFSISLPVYRRLFSAGIGAEYISLAILDKQKGNMKKYTAGKNQQVLLESGHTHSIRRTHLETVLRTRRSLLIADTVAAETPVDALLLSCNQRCLIAVPIICFDRLSGILTLGTSRPRGFDRVDLMYAETIARSMAPAIEAKIAGGLIFERDGYLGALAAFDESMAETGGADSIFEKTAGILMKNIGTTMIRISVLSRDRRALCTRALKTIRPFDGLNTDDVILDGETTPLHHEVAASHRILATGDDNGRTMIADDEAEALLFKGVKSALIIPVTASDVLLGLITLGEMRQTDRFKYDAPAILFARSIAARMADRLKYCRLLEDTFPEIGDREGRTDRRWHNRLDTHAADRLAGASRHHPVISPNDLPDRLSGSFDEENAAADKAIVIDRQGRDARRLIQKGS